MIFTIFCTGSECVTYVYPKRKKYINEEKNPFSLRLFRNARPKYHLPMSITILAQDVSIMADVRIPWEFADILSAEISVFSM